MANKRLSMAGKFYMFLSQKFLASRKCHAPLKNYHASLKKLPAKMFINATPPDERSLDIGSQMSIADQQHDIHTISIIYVAISFSILPPCFTTSTNFGFEIHVQYNMKEQGVNTISKGILVHLYSKVARLFFTSTKESKTPHIKPPQRVRTQISPQYRTRSFSDHSSNRTQEEHVLGSLVYIYIYIYIYTHTHTHLGYSVTHN